MPGFSEVSRGRQPPSIEASASFGSSAKLLEATYIQSAARTGPRSAAPPTTPGSALRGKTPQQWGASRQKVSMNSVQAEVQQRLRGAGAPPPKPTSSRSVSFNQSMPEDQEAVMQPAEEGGEYAEAEALLASVAKRLDGLNAPAAAPAALDDSLLMSPTRAPGLAGELARAQALLADATAEQSRLEAELAYERSRVGGAASEAQAELEKERARYRREVDFVRAGVDAAAAQRDAAAAKRKDVHERAVRRAVREAEERTSASAEAAAVQAEEAHYRALDEQAGRYEMQLESLSSQLVGLASEVQRLQGAGLWPGGPEAEEEPEMEELDAKGAHQLLAAAIASVERAAS